VVVSDFGWFLIEKGHFKNALFLYDLAIKIASVHV